jgi:hypothetical protein
MSDNYEFSKSCLPQGVSLESPYSDKQWSYVNDINSGIYSNAGLTLVTFDLSSIYNSSNMVDASQMFIVVPITYVNCQTSNNTSFSAVAPTTSNWLTTGLKNGYYQTLHGGDLTINGKTVEQYQPYLNGYVNFRMLSQMSQDDLKSFGTSLGMGEVLDNPQSLRYTGSGNATGTGTASAFPTNPATTYTCLGGNGVNNNEVFSATPNFGDISGTGIQGTNTYNNGLVSRLKKSVDVTNGQYTNLYGSSATTSIISSSQLATEFKPTYQVLNTNYGVWYDYAIIRLGDIFESLKNMPLVRKFDGTIRLYFNTGSTGATINATGTAGTSLTTSSSISTFTNTCPLMINTASSTLYGSSVTGVGAGLFIGKAGTTNLFGGMNLANSNASNPMTACRLYFPQVSLKPEKLIPYISENRAKKVVYTSMLTNQFNNISAGSSFSQLVQSGVKNIRGILIIPTISSTTNGTVSSSLYSSGVTTFSQWLSPFDTCPATTVPISLINLQVTIGGKNLLQNTLNYGYENFLEQVTLYEKINQADLGLSCGLINEYYWSNAYRVYYADATRGNIGDINEPRNVIVSFTNNTLQPIDVMIYVEYFNELVIDVETGLVQK